MEEPKKKKLKTWQLVLIILGGLILIGAIFGENKPSSNNTDSLTGNSVKTDEKLTILNHELTYGDYGNVEITGAAKNVAGRELSYCQIDVKYYDNEGAVIGTSLDNINKLGDGETWKFKIMYLGTDSYNVENYSISVGSCW